MKNNQLDKKGILWFLVITFGLTYAIEGVLILSGFRVTVMPAITGQLVIAGVMWVPALAAFITIKFITREGFSIACIRFGSWKPYLATALIIPVCYVIIFGLTWLLGFGQPDWTLQQFQSMIADAAGQPLPSMPSPAVVLPAMFLGTLFVSPIVNGLWAYGEELGWRGYLLPKLMPLGKPKAYLILGVVWGLWHMPIILIGFNYPGYPLLGVLMMIGLMTSLGFYINELTLRHNSSILAGWVHGLFNSQRLGVWALLFPSLNPLLGGAVGVISILMWALLGLWESRKPVSS